VFDTTLWPMPLQALAGVEVALAEPPESPSPPPNLLRGRPPCRASPSPALPRKLISTYRIFLQHSGGDISTCRPCVQ